MAEVRVVCRPEIATGFALAGLQPVEFSSDEEGRERLQELVAEAGPEGSVVLVEGGFYDRLPEDVRRQFGRRPLPMIVPFPEPSWTETPAAAEAYIIELLRQVIGYRVRLR